jgi:hypothetical protein
MFPAHRVIRHNAECYAKCSILIVAHSVTKPTGPDPAPCFVYVPTLAP